MFEPRQVGRIRRWRKRGHLYPAAAFLEDVDAFVLLWEGGVEVIERACERAAPIRSPTCRWRALQRVSLAPCAQRQV